MLVCKTIANKLGEGPFVRKMFVRIIFVRKTFVKTFFAYKVCLIKNVINVFPYSKCIIFLLAVAFVYFPRKTLSNQNTKFVNIYNFAVTVITF